MAIENEQVGTTWTRGAARGPELARVRSMDPADMMRLEAKISREMARDQAASEQGDGGVAAEAYARGIEACLLALGHQVEEA